MKNLEKKREEREEKQRIQIEFEIQQEKDLNSFKEILLKSSRWHKANNLRNYIDAVEAKALAGKSISPEFKQWLEWARKKADWYDPFIEYDDELLKGIDRETLSVNSPVRRSP